MINYLSFITLKKPFKVENYHCFNGYFNIPLSSSFYDDILISEDIHITESEVNKFFSSTKGKKITSKAFTKIYIKPVKKVLKKHKLLSLHRVKLLVGIKILSKSKYIKIAKQLSNRTTDEEIVKMVK